MLVKSHLARYCELRIDLECKDFPAIWIKVCLPKSPKYLLAGVYREWSDSNGTQPIAKQSELLAKFGETITVARKNKNDVVLAGDWNLNLKKFDANDWHLKHERKPSITCANVRT